MHRVPLEGRDLHVLTRPPGLREPPSAAHVSAAEAATHAATVVDLPESPREGGLSWSAALSLAVWREVRARGGLFLLLPGLMAVGLPMAATQREALYAFLALVVAPALVVLVAARGEGRADAFWRGLGGPAWARLLGVVALHSVVLGGPLGVLLSTVMLSEALLWLTWELSMAEGMLAGGLLYGLLYTATLAARSRVSGLTVLAGPLLALSTVAGSGVVGLLWVGGWAPRLAFLARSLPILLLAGGLALLWERSLGVWGGGLQPARHGWRLILLLLGVSGASLSIEALSLRLVLPADAELRGVSPDGSAVWFSTEWDRGGRVWYRDPAGALHLLPVPLASLLSAGPHEAALVDKTDPLHQTGTLQLMTPAGTATCPGVWPQNTTWRADGRAAAFLSHGGRAVQLDLVTGCSTLGEASAAIWLGDRLLLHHQGALLDAQTRTPILSASVRETAPMGSAGIALLLEEVEAGIVSVARLDAAQHLTTLLEVPAQDLFLWEIPDGVCVVLRDSGRQTTCWNAAGTQTLSGHLGKNWYPVDSTHVLDGTSRRLEETTTGHGWSVPEGTWPLLLAGEVWVAQEGWLRTLEPSAP